MLMLDEVVEHININRAADVMFVDICDYLHVDHVSKIRS